MDRGKMLAARLTTGVAWLATAGATLAAAYGGSAVVAHMGRYIDWR